MSGYAAARVGPTVNRNGWTVTDFRVDAQPPLSTCPAEHAAYFEVPGAHLYTVLHAARDPIARVLLVGPFASERHYSYIPWVRWARYLAARKIECLRYDYRGIGESTGAFSEMRFENWIEDVQLLADWLKRCTPDAPLLLHGLELGALLAAKAFETGFGDALLLWAPPLTANDALRTTLLRRVAMDNAFKYGDERKPALHYLKQLEEGGCLEVEGYQWVSRLWYESFTIRLPAPIAAEEGVRSAYGRPVRVVTPNKLAAPLIKGSSVNYEAIHRDFTTLFAENSDWITSALS